MSAKDVVKILRSSALTSRNHLVGGIQGSLPEDQWQLEVENWNSISLASLQGGTVDIATGPGDTAMLEHFWRGPVNDEERLLCQNQVSLIF